MTYEEAKKKLEEVIGSPIVEITEWDDYYAEEYAGFNGETSAD